MVAAGEVPGYAQKLGVKRSMVVQELGWDEDTDDDMRADIEDAIGRAMVDDETDEVVEAALLWWRAGDGDLVDELTDIVRPLAEEGFVWVLTPRTGRPGFVDQNEIAEVADASGLTHTDTVTLGSWSGSRFVRPGTSAEQGW
ncbi:DUF3052 domain-containing protein [Embleya sp. NPDC001921]